MTDFDAAILLFLNQFARISPAFDTFMVLCATNDLIKGGVIAATWWAWLGKPRRPGGAPVRTVLAATLLGCLLAFGVARVLALALPFRTRPLANPAFAFSLPYGADTLEVEGWGGWSAFPSDHAVLFVGLAVGLLFLHRTAGLLTLGYTLFVDGFTRVYLGVHHPTDTLVGAVLGAAGVAGVTASLLALPVLRERVENALARLTWTVAGPLLFLVTFEAGNAFVGVRGVARWLVDLVRNTPT